MATKIEKLEENVWAGVRTCFAGLVIILCLCASLSILALAGKLLTHLYLGPQ